MVTHVRFGNEMNTEIRIDVTRELILHGDSVRSLDVVSFVEYDTYNPTEAALHK